jgi:hypothetical protein
MKMKIDQGFNKVDDAGIIFFLIFKYPNFFILKYLSIAGKKILMIAKIK